MYNIGDFTDQELLELSSNIYDWYHSSDGCVANDSLLRKMYDEKVPDNYLSMNEFAVSIVNKAANKFEKLIKTSLSVCPHKFLVE